MLRKIVLAFVLIAGLEAAYSYAQKIESGGPLQPSAIAQINALIREKQARTAVERKMSSRLLYARKMAQGLPVAEGVTRLDVRLPSAADGRVVLDVRAEVSAALLDQLRGLGAEILDSNVSLRNVRLLVSLARVHAIAALQDVIFVQPKQEAFTESQRGRMDPSLTREQWRRLPNGQVPIDRTELISRIERGLNARGVATNSGSVQSQGDKAHAADTARFTHGIDGTGVKIGVLSDDVCHLADAQASGDLPPGVIVLPGQTGDCSAGGGDEGTAMLEIVHDLAPGAKLYFASAFLGTTSFADNIRALRAAGCFIIIDDVGYFVESPFQDGQAAAVISPTNGGVVTQAVKDVAADGALYFSSAANSGNLNDGTSGTWEGDFLAGSVATDPLAGAGQLHNFGGGQNYDVMTSNTKVVTLFWSDPLGSSGNDYDVYVLNSAGTMVVDGSADAQDGNDDPFEFVGGAFTGERIVIAKFSGAGRFLHLDTNRGTLSIATAGNTHGHPTTTAANTFSVAATPAQFPGPFPSPFNSANAVETFSSDGPRRIFFAGSGAAITPGNFSSTGGQLLNKPDLTAADGVSVSGAGTFPTTFYGTSAAAPHAGAIAALIKSAKGSLTASQVTTALLNSAIDIEAPGIDRDSGVGIIMAHTAVGSVEPVPFTDPTLIAGVTLIKAVHLTELRTRINALRAAHLLGVFSFTDPTITVTSTGIRAVHLTEARTALGQVYAAAGMTPPTWTDPVLSSNIPVKAAHVMELRRAIQAIE